MMSSIDLILLGLVLKAPSSAYDLQKAVEYRHLAHWVRISTPSIYKKVLSLEQRGYLKSVPSPAVKRTEKAVYHITPSGQSYFEEQMRAVSRSPIPILFDFNAVIANLNKLSPEEARKEIADIRAQIENTRAFTEEMSARREHIPLVGRAVLAQQLAVANALAGWVAQFEAEFRKETE